MTDTLRSALTGAVDLVPDLGTWWFVLLLAPLLLAAVTALTAGRFPVVPEVGPLRIVALVATVLSLVGAVGVALHRPVLEVPWIPSLGVWFALRPDGLSLPLVLLTAVVGLVALALVPGLEVLPEEESPGSLPESEPTSARPFATYYGSLLLVLLGAQLAFLAGDALLFFIAFELVLIPMWLLIARHGDPRGAEGAARRFLMVTVVGSSLVLAGLLTVATATGTTDLTVWAATGPGLGRGTQIGAAALLLLGLAVKVPLFPLHTWLPWVHSTAPTAGSVVLAAVLLKLGTYGMARLVVPVVPDGFTVWAPLLGGLAVTGILWAGLACLVERDLKRLIAWSSIAHLGFVVLAMAAGTATGLQAALYGNVAHGVVAALLFVVVGGLKERWGDADLGTARAALRETTPTFGAALALGVAAAMGLPGLAGFWGEIGAVYAAWSPADTRPEGWFRLFAVGAAAGAVLAVAYGVRVLSEVWLGDRLEPAVPDADPPERFGLRLLGVLVLVLGVYPVALLSMTAPWVEGVIGR